MKPCSKEVHAVSQAILKRDLIEENLSRVLGKLKPAAMAETQWEFGASSGEIAKGTASLEEDWLVLSAAVSSRSQIRTSFRRGGPWSLAIRNGEMGGGSKLRIVGSADALHLRNEIWVGPGRRAAAAIESGCHLFQEGISTLETRPEIGAPRLFDKTSNPLPDVLGDLQDMAASLDWPLEERSSGDLVSNLDLGNRGVYQIRLRPEPDGHLRAWSAILSEQELDPTCRRALGLLLARANDQLRLVRGAVYQNQGRDSVHFEVVQRDPFCPEQIKLMLSSLTAACWKCGPEIRLLTSPEIAQRTLKSFGTAHMANPA